MEMLLVRSAEHQDIIKENDNELPQTRSQSNIHRSLEGPWGTNQSKQHHTELILAKMRLERRFELFTRLETDLMEPRAQVQIGKP